MTEPNDKLLDEYVRGESPVSQRYRELEAHDVPPQLDATVLAQARAAVAKRNERKPTWVRWGAPLALAASAVMAVAIVLEVGVQDEVRMPAPHMEPRAEQLTSAERAQDLRVIQDVNPAVPVDLQRTLQAPPNVANEQPVQARAAATPKVERVSERKEVSEPSVATTAARESVAQDAAAETRTAGAAEDAPDRAAARMRAPSESAATEMAPQPPQAPRPVAAFSSRTSAAAVPPQEAPRLSAEEWLERIRTLRRAGKVLEADEQWREFRKTYPDFAVNETDLAQPKPAP